MAERLHRHWQQWASTSLQQCWKCQYSSYSAHKEKWQRSLQVSRKKPSWKERNAFTWSKTYCLWVLILRVYNADCILLLNWFGIQTCRCSYEGGWWVVQEIVKKCVHRVIISPQPSQVWGHAGGGWKKTGIIFFTGIWGGGREHTGIHSPPKFSFIEGCMQNYPNFRVHSEVHFRRGHPPPPLPFCEV